MNSLSLKNLKISIENQEILKNINLTINKGETVLIVGPNGHGKSTLLKAIMNHYDTQITNGEILIDNVNVNDLDTSERAKMGLYLASQYPIEIPGVNMLEFLRAMLSSYNNDQKVEILDLYTKINKNIKKLKMNPDLLSRNLNENFSGGERKKNEILQCLILNPDFILLDEIDSGLDIDSLNIISENLKEMQHDKTIVYISHNNKLFNDIVPDKVVLIVNGQIVTIGDKELAYRIDREGYGWIEKEYNISIIKDNKTKDVFDNDDFLNEMKGFSCNGSH